MWTAVASVSTWFTLGAFVIAAVVTVLRSREQHTLKLIESVPKQQRADLVERLFQDRYFRDRYRMEKDTLSSEQKEALIRQQIEIRRERQKLMAQVISLVAVLGAAVTVVFWFKPDLRLRNAGPPVLAQALTDGEKSGITALEEINRRLTEEPGKGADLIDVLCNQGLGDKASPSVREGALNILLKHLDNPQWGRKAIDGAASVYVSLDRGDEQLPEQDERRRRAIDNAFGELWHNNDAVFEKVLCDKGASWETQTYLQEFLEGRVMTGVDKADLAKQILANTQ